MVCCHVMLGHVCSLFMLVSCPERQYAIHVVYGCSAAGLILPAACVRETEAFGARAHPLYGPELPTCQCLE